MLISFESYVFDEILSDLDLFVSVKIAIIYVKFCILCH